MLRKPIQYQRVSDPPYRISYHPSFFIPAKTQPFTHSQGNISSTFGQENTITKIPKRLNVFLKNKRDLGVFISIFLLQKKAGREMQFM